VSATSLPVLPLNVSGIDANDYKQPAVDQFSLGIQQALGATSVLSISYVGSQSRHENDYEEINLPPLADLPGLVAGNGTLNGLGINQYMSYPGFAGLRLARNEADGHYNSLQADLHANLRHDLTLEFGYTYSQAIDATTSNGSGGDLNNTTNPYAGWRYDLGPSPYDRRNVAFVNFVYGLPFFKNSDSHLLRSAVGGWQLSGIVTMESGAPLNIGLNGENASSVVPNSSNRPDQIAPISYPKSVNEWFNPADFAAPACATGPDCYGDLGHDVVRGPGRDDWNLALFKTFVISEARGTRFEFRAESFNTWNHTQFKGDANNGGMSLSQGASNFGAVTSAFDPREFQLVGKLIF
jgi:hypothetical protein